MEIRGSRVLILGGSGLVGIAIARELLPHRPEVIVLSALTREEAEQAVADLEREAGDHEVRLSAAWGDIFLPHDLKDRRRSDILADAAARSILLDELYSTPSSDAVARSALGALLIEHKPHVLVDCINTATVFAYQNTFASAAGLREAAREGPVDGEQVERHLATMYLPQLIRHAQIALEAMSRAGTKSYVKVGTAGTGGMGLNIPFTHSEERPSRMLLAKSSLAGAHTLLLFLMARTPGAPAVKEIKPTAAISWKRVAYGEIVRGGRAVARIDSTEPVDVETAMNTDDGWRETGETLHGVYVDSGENGLFSPAEFETLTALGLMEFITPEEIARDVVREIAGHATGRDVVAALDASTSGPTYRAGVLRQHVIERMDELEKEHSVDSLAYEMLGPPRLSKLLFESAILSRLCDGSLDAAAALDADSAATRAEVLVTDDRDLRTRILSIGFPILLPDGRRLLRGAEIKVRPGAEIGADRERLIDSGWVDLRPVNWAKWRGRAAAMLAESTGAAGADAGSRVDLESWHGSRRIRPGTLAAWVFRREDRGERIKR
jgi:NAD(P)-dependent dehydrogenase (short-subunit alcohol dehydrogenase family)